MRVIPRVRRELTVYGVTETSAFPVELTHRIAILQGLYPLLCNKQRLLLLCVEITLTITSSYHLLSAYCVLNVFGISSNSCKDLWKSSTVIVPILHTRKLRLMEVN